MYNYLVRRNNLIKDFINEDFSNDSYMRTNIKEEADKYLFEIELAGFKKEDIKLSIEGGYFNVSIKRECENSEDLKVLRSERFYGERSRSFYVANVLKDRITANYNNGILSVSIPKDLEAENKKYIDIN